MNPFLIRLASHVLNEKPIFDARATNWSLSILLLTIRSTREELSFFRMLKHPSELNKPLRNASMILESVAESIGLGV